MRKIISSLLVLVLTACSTVNQGTVENKSFTSGYFSRSCYKAYTNSHKVRICSGYKYNSPEWRLLIRHGDSENWVNVTKPVYAREKIGGHWSR